MSDMSIPVDQLRSEYPTLFYHTVPPASVASRHMADLRARYIALAQLVLDLCPPGRAKALALTHLEDSLLRSIQSLALTGELHDYRPQEEQR